MSQTVHVVSMEDVTTRDGEMVFHEKLVSGADVGVGFFAFEVASERT